MGGTRPGNASFVPPPPGLVEDCMAALEQFIHGGPEGEHALPVLVRAALAHVQFETIHPFLDGNGRLGRLLIVLMLIEAGVLGQPLLYLSLFFKQHRSRYYELLDGVRQNGDWETWIDFFLEGVESTASGAVAKAQRLLELFRVDEARLMGLGRSGVSVQLCYRTLRRRPLTSINQLRELSGLSAPTASKQGNRNPGGPRHRPGNHWRASKSAVRL
ncbi:Fic family protein [Synechococcus sp. BSF8S]|uniref:Fic family protein n=1 Tax=Synechococcales TaxID=1890424 RepID=UPI00351CA4B4